MSWPKHVMKITAYRQTERIKYYNLLNKYFCWKSIYKARHTNLRSIKPNDYCCIDYLFIYLLYLKKVTKPFIIETAWSLSSKDALHKYDSLLKFSTITRSTSYQTCYKINTMIHKNSKNFYVRKLIYTIFVASYSIFRLSL